MDVQVTRVYRSRCGARVADLAYSRANCLRLCTTAILVKITMVIDARPVLLQYCSYRVTLDSGKCPAVRNSFGAH